jgi:glucan phosphoethanolaminetransferase (alkaline phosphatase superfamily)
MLFSAPAQRNRQALGGRRAHHRRHLLWRGYHQQLSRQQACLLSSVICHVLCSDTAVVHCIKLIHSSHLTLLQSLASALAVLLLTRIVELSHGPRELAKYLAAVIVLSSCLTVAVIATPHLLRVCNL